MTYQQVVTHNTEKLIQNERTKVLQTMGSKFKPSVILDYIHRKFNGMDIILPQERYDLENTTSQRVQVDWANQDHDGLMNNNIGEPDESIHYGDNLEAAKTMLAESLAKLNSISQEDLIYYNFEYDGTISIGYYEEHQVKIMTELQLVNKLKDEHKIIWNDTSGEYL